MASSSSSALPETAGFGALSGLLPEAAGFGVLSGLLPEAARFGVLSGLLPHPASTKTSAAAPAMSGATMPHAIVLFSFMLFILSSLIKNVMWYAPSTHTACIFKPLHTERLIPVSPEHAVFGVFPAAYPLYSRLLPEHEPSTIHISRW
jgi:hypothetical protein